MSNDLSDKEVAKAAEALQAWFMSQEISPGSAITVMTLLQVTQIAHECDGDIEKSLVMLNKLNKGAKQVLATLAIYYGERG